MGSRQVRQHCQLSTEASGYLEHAMEEMNFSARAHDRILKVARTLADLAGAVDVEKDGIARDQPDPEACPTEDEENETDFKDKDQEA